MADNEKGCVTAGFSLLWRRQGMCWWVFAVNVACGALGALPAALTLNRALHHTLAGQSLSKGFDLGMYFELVRLPGVNLMRSTISSYVFAFLFFLFMLFVSGGILQTYHEDRGLTIGEFFAASGTFFWRFVRLLLLSLVPFIGVSTVYQGLDTLSDYLGDRAIADQVGIYISLVAVVVSLLLALVVRLWFDIAQVRAVAQNERHMWNMTWTSLGMTWRNLGSLFWMYFRITLVAWVTLAVGLVIWAHLPPTATPVTFVLLELILVAQLATRLWQLASTTVWYQRHAEPVLTDLVESTATQPEGVIEVAETPAVSEPDLPPLSEPGLPSMGA
jgi:hypothetical protein